MIAAVAASAATNFAGTWELDKSKSQLTGRMANIDSLTWTITQTDKDLTIESQASGGGNQMPAQKTTYSLDGKETTVEFGGQMPGKATLKATWSSDGKVLELSQVRHASMQGNEVTITTKEHWELAEGGKVLKVHRVSESPRGTQESTLVFNKK
jgi:hypothetical protein